MNQSTVFTVGVIAVSTAFLLPAGQVANADVRIPPIVGYPYSVRTSYDDAATKITISVPITRGAAAPTLSVPLSVPSLLADHADKGTVMARLTKMRQLADGWLGAGSTAPDSHLLDWLDLHANVIAASRYPISIIPLGDGALALEWRANAREYTAELHSDNQMFLVVDDTATDELNEKTVSLDARSLEEFISSGILV